MLKEFQEFISKGNVMDLAVGVIIGGAFGLIVIVAGRRHHHADRRRDLRRLRLLQLLPAAVLDRHGDLARGGARSRARSSPMATSSPSHQLPDPRLDHLPDGQGGERRCASRLEKQKPAAPAAPPPADVAAADRNPRSAGQEVARSRRWTYENPRPRRRPGFSCRACPRRHPAKPCYGHAVEPKRIAMSLIDVLRAEARLAPVSGIEAVVNYGRGRPGLIPLWAGEGDLPTPDFITEAAMRGAAATARPSTPGRAASRNCARRSRAITSAISAAIFRRTNSSSPVGGMQAIQLALQATAGAGDEAIYLTPAWPNFAGAAGVAGAHAGSGPARPGRQWLVLRRGHGSRPRSRRARRRSSSTRRPTRPAGPPTCETLQAILDLARRHGLWIIADEIYALFHYERAARAVLHGHHGAGGPHPLRQHLFQELGDDRLAHRLAARRIRRCGACSKTSSSIRPRAWRSSCSAARSPRSTRATPSSPRRSSGRRQARDLVCRILGETGRVRFSVPPGAFYLFFSVDGVTRFARRPPSTSSTRPMSAWRRALPSAQAGEGFFRLCFHRRLDQVEEAANRLAEWR